MKEGRKEIWKFKLVIFPNAREEFQRKTLTEDSDGDFLLFGIFPARHPACVEASVWTLELGDGQNIVEQHVRSMFQEPLGSEACVVDLKVERRKSHKMNTEGSPLCRSHLFWKGLTSRGGSLVNGNYIINKQKEKKKKSIHWFTTPLSDS